MRNGGRGLILGVGRFLKGMNRNEKRKIKRIVRVDTENGCLHVFGHGFPASLDAWVRYDAVRCDRSEANWARLRRSAGL